METVGALLLEGIRNDGILDLVCQHIAARLIAISIIELIISFALSQKMYRI